MSLSSLHDALAPTDTPSRLPDDATLAAFGVHGFPAHAENWDTWVHEGVYGMAREKALAWHIAVINRLLALHGDLLAGTTLGAWCCDHGAGHPNLHVGEHRWWWEKGGRSTEIRLRLCKAVADIGGDRAKVEQTRKDFWASFGAEHKYGMDWVAACLGADNPDGARQLLDQGVCFHAQPETAPTRFHHTPKPGIPGPLATQVRTLYNTIGGNGAPKSLVNFNPHTPQAIHAPWDEEVARRWTLLLDSGVPMLSALGQPLKLGVHVFKAEFTRGGLREAVSRTEWLAMGHLPAQDATHPDWTVFDWARHHGFFPVFDLQDLQNLRERYKGAPAVFFRILERLDGVDVRFGPGPASTSSLLADCVKSKANPWDIDRLVRMGVALGGPNAAGEGVWLQFARSLQKNSGAMKATLGLLEPHARQAVVTDVALPDKDGVTFLHVALPFLAPSMLQWCLDHGGRLDAADNGGHTPLTELAAHAPTNQMMERGHATVWDDLCGHHGDWLFGHHLDLAITAHPQTPPALSSLLEKARLEWGMETRAVSRPGRRL
jgi:hypothetical protein